jgi:hypothetical protein
MKKKSGTSPAKFSKLQVPTDISEKALQNPDNSAQLLHNTPMGTRETAGISAFLYCFSQVAYMAEALCYKPKGH